MSNEPLPPIPMPPGQRWKHFRQQGLPALAFAGVLVVAVWLWGANLANPLVMGQADARLVEITSPVDGEVMQLQVELYQKVYAGDVLAVVAGAKPDVLSNTLAVIRAEMDTAVSEAVSAPADRMRLTTLQLEWLDLREEIATLRASLVYADAELIRDEILIKEGIISQSVLDLSRASALAIKEAIAGKEKAVSHAEAALLQITGDGQESKYVQVHLRLANEQLRLAESELTPTVLRAPINGHVCRLDVAANGIVTRRQPLLAIANEKVERIVGYIPQPVRIEPRIGMSVEVRTRGSHRAVARSTVNNIGPRIELFDAPLRIRGMGAAQERGLPIVVSVPEDMQLRPGELVDLRLIED